MRIASIQLEMDDRKTKKDRLEQVTGMLAELAGREQKPDLVLLPELWGAGYFNFSAYLTHSETALGETFTALSPLAKEAGFYLLAGSILEREGDSLYNSALLIGPGGNLAAKYRKINLFGYESKEALLLTPGKLPVVVDTEWGKWGIATCFDLRFPEIYRQMLAAGADVFLVVAAWPAARLEHWQLFNKVRALENQCYLVSCNCAGKMNGVEFAGHSMVVDPWGIVNKSAGSRPVIMEVEIDLGKVERTRAEFPLSRVSHS
ncbi:MAG TPA: carbon-nitrogen family hydrolase [Firmicutes bacterium]|nr:carbon-nitrogen family hydrolase [Bacillota bacterium]